MQGKKGTGKAGTLITFEGRPCIHGHGTTRYSAGGACIVCSRNNSKLRWRQLDEAWKIQRRKKYADEGREDRRNRNLQRNYQITVHDYDIMVAEQDNKCALCGGLPGGSAGRFHVDHDHNTGKIRALLCHTCNVGLGSFQDSPELLEQAAEYLRRFGKV